MQYCQLTEISAKKHKSGRMEKSAASSLHVVNDNESADMQYCQLTEILAKKHKSGRMEKISS
jgi:hypothetical protein